MSLGPYPIISRVIGQVVGDSSLRGLLLPRGAQIAGMIVDNFSGSWLYCPQTQQYVPPLTAGWATIVSPTQAAIDLIYQKGPNNLASTNTGTPAVVQLFSAPVQNNPGVSVGSSGALVPFASVVNPSGNYLVTLPSDAGILWLLWVPIGADTLTYTSVTGETTFAKYGLGKTLSASSSIALPLAAVQMAPQEDAQVLLNGLSATGSGTLYLLSSPGILRQDIQNIFGTVTVQGNNSNQFDAVGSEGNLVPTQDELLGWNGTAFDRLRAFGDDADAVPVNTLGALLSLSRLTAFNGTSWDRVQSNHSSIKVVQTPPSVGTYVGLQNIVPGVNFFGVLTNDSYRGVTVMLVINSISGGGNVSLRCEEIALDAGSDFNTLLTSGTINAVGQRIQLTLYPGLAAVANLVASAVCPYLWRPEPVLSAGAANVSIYYHYIA